MKIVIVDDEEIIRQGLSAIIERQLDGVKIVATAANGQEALEAIRDTQPDIVITDIRMPLIDGTGLIKELAKLNIRPRPQIIVLSGFDEYQLVREALKNGAMDYLLKPVEEEALFELIRQAREQLLRERENATSTELPGERLSALREKLLMELVAEGDERNREEKNRKVIEQAKQYIRQHYAEEISLRSIADHVALNPTYFSEMFKRETETNYIDFLIDTRMNEAKKLLLDDTLKVYEIANRVGYEDVKSFIRAFKKVMGIPPVKYRHIANKPKK